MDYNYNYPNAILHYPIHIGEYNNVNKKEAIEGGFLDNPHYLDWVALFGLIRPPSELPP